MIMLENSIFHFNDKPALDIQDPGTCAAVFKDFWDKIVSSEWTQTAFPNKDFAPYASVCHGIHWFPSYGGAILFRRLDSIEVFVTVVGLDGWKHWVHASEGHGRENTSKPDIFAPALFELGPFPMDKLEKLMAELNKKLAESEDYNRRDRRGQGGGHEGNQKTPSFLQEKLRQVINVVGETDVEMQDGTLGGTFQGGTTDVGLHTGCKKRNTSAPLAFAVTQTILRFSGEGDNDCFRTLLAIYLTGFLAVLPKVSKYDARKMDRFMTVIREAEAHVDKMKNTHLQGKLLEYMKSFRDALLAVPYSDGPIVLENRPIVDIINRLSDPEMPHVPAMPNEDDPSSELERARSDARNNLGWSNIEAKTFNGKHQDAWIQLHALNTYFWGLSGKLNNSREQVVMSELVSELDRLRAVVTNAREAADKTVLVMSKALRSYECLATWISFCWAHKMAEREFAWFSEYKPALDPNRLQVLVLEYKEAKDAATNVREFLETRSNRRLCAFRDADATLRLAQQYGSSSTEFQKIYQDFIKDADRRIDERWNIVQKKQAELRRLDPLLRGAENELQSASAATRRAEQVYGYYDQWGRRRYEQGYHDAVTKENGAQAKVSSLQSQIKQQEAKPAILLFGLPRGLRPAMRWLFFFYMHPSFQQVASLAHRGQSLLWHSVPAPKQIRMFLRDWFNSHGWFPASRDGSMVLGTQSDSPKISLPDIRVWTREEGVFFPDGFSEVPVWLSSNPFDHIDTKSLTLLYTEKNPGTVGQPDSDFIQNLIAFLPSNLRENDGIARRQKRPEWLSQEQFHAFSSMRATGRTQLRHLLHVFYENLLPFHNKNVHILLKQAIFQFGEKDWFNDLYSGSCKGLDLLHECFKDELCTLSDSPRNCTRLQLVGILLSFFGQYHFGCAESARQASTTFEDWARSIPNDTKVESSDNRYSKQALFYASALLCLSFFEPESQDIKAMARLVVLYRNCALLSRGTVDASLEGAVLKVMGSRIKRIFEFSRANRSFLSTVLKLVDETAPSSGQWHCVDIPGAASTGCFEMFDKHLYSINLMNGVVLFDGSPKNFLPKSVVVSSIFKRTFGARQNFEVIRIGFQHYRTTRAMNGRFYAFKNDPSQDLCIFEYDACSGKMGFDESCLSPSKSFSVRRNLRNDQPWNILVPQKDRKMSIKGLCEKTASYERLCVGTTSFGSALDASGFEKASFILTFAEPSGKSIRYFLPRYSMNFVQDSTSVRSQDYEGFFVSKNQELLDTLPSLRCFLSLTHLQGVETILIPSVPVERGCQMAVSELWDDKLHVHQYRRHSRFQLLISSDTLGRLHLASLYASNGCNLPDRLMCKPGTDVASDLVRMCAQNDVFRDDETQKLIEIANHSALSCTLRILIWWTWRSSVSLVQPYSRKLERKTSLGYDILAVDEYRGNEYASRLSKEEEIIIFGFASHSGTILAGDQRTKSLSSLVTSHVNFVRGIEDNLYLTGVKVQKPKRKLVFPLDLKMQTGDIPTKVVQDLKDSYDSFSKLPRHGVNSIEIEPHLNTVFKKREIIERNLVDLLNKTRSLALVGARVTGRTRCASRIDLMRVVYDPTHVFLFQPNNRDVLNFQADCIGWCLLCVLEDKLRRLKNAVAQNLEEEAVRELQCIRKWDPAVHPRWLAFEVEQTLQIRPKQYTTVQQLLENPGSVIQLNMGEGKTRVLVPMLVMELCSSRRRKARINLLPAIFHEALQFYRLSLLASEQNIKLFTIPFQRDFVLDGKSGKIIEEEMQRCWSFGGCIVATPQHRMSLVLKQHDCESFVLGLDDDVVDILDESDAILDYNFQLVYAIGDQIPLPSCMTRCVAAETVLAIASRLAKDRGAECGKTRLAIENVPPGEFTNVRILESTHVSERAFSRAIANCLLDEPPYQFRWMKTIPNDSKDLLLTLFVDPSLQLVGKTINDHRVFERNKEDILAVRGCLAFGLAVHALKNRYRVSYGLKLFHNEEGFGHGTRATKLAVPYAASDTPKARAEFSHPDMAIIYTCLSYLHEGLSVSQFKEAMKILDNKSKGLQHRLFSMWINDIEDGVPRDELERFDSIQKVDMSNEEQVQIMYKRLRRCMGVVFFWLNEVVFPNETHQFPQRRVTSAWNLTHNGQAIGFSGTNDNRFLLPLSVTQIPHKDMELHATNGQMVDRILSCTKVVHLFGSSADTSWWQRTKNLVSVNLATPKPALWQVILADSLRLGANALIDVGGLMAGASPLDIVEYLACNVENALWDRVIEYRGVVYFSASSDQWIVYQVESKRHIPLARSSIKENKCLVYFDESRCRGSDMKLLPSAVAVVTLDKRMTKDKFLQGCARMRKLAPGFQSLIIAGTEETVNSKSTAKSILEDVIHASIRAAQRGLMTFYDRARNFDTFPKPVDDELELESLYAGHITEYDDFCQYLDVYCVREHVSESMEKVVDYCRSTGNGVEVHLSKIGQECEKEVEAEAEEEEEQETQVEFRNPYHQTDWDYDIVFAGSYKQLFSTTFVKLGDIVAEKLKAFERIRWSNKVFCSPNFFRTIACYSQSQNLSLFLRQASHLIVFRDGNVVLVSAYEMDKLLPYWWNEGGRPRAVLTNLFLLTKGHSLDSRTLPVSSEVMTTLKLFRGSVNYTASEKVILRDMLQYLENPHDKVQALLFIRNRLGHFERSDLDEVSYQARCET